MKFEGTGGAAAGRFLTPASVDGFDGCMSKYFIRVRFRKTLEE
jgi:hypothetical protein